MNVLCGAGALARVTLFFGIIEFSGSAGGPVIVPVFKTGGWQAILSLMGSTPIRFRQVPLRKDVEVQRHWSSLAALLIHTAGQDATIHRQDGSGDKAGGIGCEKNGCSDELFQFAQTFHWGAHQHLITSASSDQKFFA